MKKVVEEVTVDEKMYLLKENNEIVKNKEYNGIKDATYKGVRRSTEPSVTLENGAQKSNSSIYISQSQKELNKNIVSNEKLNSE